MIIQLDDAQERRLLQWAREIAAHEVALDIEPSGYEISIEVVPAIGAFAVATCGNETIELGPVQLSLSTATSAETGDESRSEG